MPIEPSLPNREDVPLTIDEMNFLLSQEGHSYIAGKAAVELEIKRFKLQLQVDGNKVVPVGESTDAFLSRFITVDPTMLQVKEDVHKLAKVEEDKDQLFAVLINGPTGTGKEILAYALHGDRIGDFIPINCAGLPSELVESELFGHTKGSFTNAFTEKQGLMKLANKGTLFLDEVGELPMPAQAKLLRAIQSKKIRKVGGSVDEIISCRIVCATHRNLKEMCKNEKFRIDLYSRISTFELNTTELEKRHEDIIPIIESISGGKEFLEALITNNIHWRDLDLSLNVRSLQQHIKRYKVLQKLPI